MRCGVALRSGWYAWNGMLVAEWLECAWSGWYAWNGMLVAEWLECMLRSGWSGVRVLEVREAMQHDGLSNNVMFRD